MGILPILIRLAFSHGFPEPMATDEFSYLLGADTFASGRITNPPHPMWQHFETWHVISQPTYASRYPPAQALFLAAGQRFFGHPWYGVCISFGLLCACLCWMLQGWMPPLYALLGTLVGLGQIGIFGYWMNSYWGGAVAAAGGCLVLGAIARFERRPTLAAAVLGCCGVALTAFSRPLEGGIVILVAGAMTLLRRRHRKRKLSELLVPAVILPALLTSAFITGALAYYNYRVTGKPLLMPYMLYERTYAEAPFLLFMPIRHLTYRHDVMRQYYAHETLQLFRTKRTHPWINVLMLQSLLPFYASTIVAFAMLVAAFLVRSFRLRMALAVMAALCLTLLVEKSPHIHYIAAGCGLVCAVSMYGVRFLCLKAGRFGPVLLSLFVLVVFGQGLMSYWGSGHGPNPRTLLTRELLKTGGRHLVLVRYDITQPLQFEYVYNGANIDAAPVVWARDMGVAKNEELVNYYRDRKVWLLEPDRKPAVLTPYLGSDVETGGTRAALGEER
jgi:hypothetical protein